MESVYAKRLSQNCSFNCFAKKNEKQRSFHTYNYEKQQWFGRYNNWLMLLLLFLFKNFLFTYDLASVSVYYVFP